MRELPKYDYDRAIALVEIWYTHEKIKAREPVMGAVLDAIANAKLASPVRRQVKRATGTAGPRGRQAARLAAEKILAGPDSPAKCFLLARREVAEFARRSQIAQESTINDGIPS
ncbi:MAG: hypothetical protein KOO60_07265 [Gemmatimonadales bacterium]|nr:hypothetical protein [Gemmatimonadales bacterium]